MCLQPLAGQDTLRTYGPRIGIDLARFAYIFANPSQVGAELSVDAEIYRNFYPVFEMGYSRVSENEDLFDYSSAGGYARLGLDYNFLDMKDRSIHHSITVGFRYGLSVFGHQVDGVKISSDYWGDLALEPYENNLAGNWLELVGGI